MANLLAELKRRHVYRVAAAYAVVAWLLIQLVNNVAPALRLPEWAPTLVVVLLLVGFPIVLLIAWMRELAPADGSTARAVTGKLDLALMGALIAVIALVSYQQVTQSAGERAVPAQQAGVEAARAVAASPASAISIAVLPFTNLSSDPEQEFFSDGMTEEITSALAKIPDLRVVGRTSAFQFKGQNQDLRAIGQALSATHLLEGSVRKEGARVRITAQLIQSENGVHVWTESYDRELTGVFAIQEDIATAIAGALRMPLGLKPGENLVNNRRINPESYQQYLRARTLVRTRGIRQLTAAIALLDQVVARDSNYAPAWALLAQAHRNVPTSFPGLLTGSAEEGRRVVQSSQGKAELAAQKAIQLDANLADGYMAMGGVHLRVGKFLLAEDLFSKALTLDPNNPDTLHWYSYLLASVGRINEALAMRQPLETLEPFVFIFNTGNVRILWVSGQTDAAIAMLKEIRGGPVDFARIYAAEGRYSEAVDALSSSASGDPTVDAALHLLRTAPAATASPQTLPRLGNFNFVYLHVGAVDRVLEYYEDGIEVGNFVNQQTALLWHPSYAPVRKTERFKAYARKVGLVEYWRAKGWPGFCHPTGAEDFVCD